MAIFARDLSPALAGLAKKIDEATSKNAAARMGSFVVVLTDDTDGTEPKLKQLAEKEGLKKLVLAIDSPQGPPKYKLSKDADVTVMLYHKHTVKKNFAFEKGKLTDKDADDIVASLKEILPEGK